MAINRSLILRLARYLRVLQQLKDLGFVKVFSNNLGDAIGVTPAVVRKDLSSIHVSGNKRGGYNIDTLISELGSILGKQARQSVIVVGCGRIGSALLNYDGFEREGIEVVAGFDAVPERIDRTQKPPVLPTDELDDFVRDNGIEVGIIAVPSDRATAAFEQMMEAGIRGFLNFTNVELKCGGKCDPATCARRCVVQHVNIGLELENVFYLVRHADSDASDFPFSDRAVIDTQ